MEATKRKVVHRSPAHTVRLIHQPHLQAEPIEADSSFERDFVHITGLYCHVVKIQHQPFRLMLDDATYTPDFLLTFKDQSKLVVEVKPFDRIEEYRDLFDRASKKLHQSGYFFLVATEAHFRSNGIADNALEIRRYGKSSFDAASCEKIVSGLADHPDGLTIQELRLKYRVPREQILHLICKRLITTQPGLATLDGDLVFTPQNINKEKDHAIQFAAWINAEIWSTNT